MKQPDEGNVSDLSIREVRAKHPLFLEAVLADTRVTSAYRRERYEYRTKVEAIVQALKLAWSTDAFFAQVLYRAKARLQALGVPMLPRLLHRAAMMIAQVCIGDSVLVHPGVYFNHGQVTIDGYVEIHADVVIAPWVTIGLRAGNFQGPVVGPGVHVGTGAKVIGPIEVGARAVIGANAVVVDNVPPGATVVGAPARVVRDRRECDKQVQ